jgi:hypothetical protein
MVVVYGKGSKEASGKLINISRDFPSPLISNSVHPGISG